MDIDDINNMNIEPNIRKFIASSELFSGFEVYIITYIIKIYKYINFEYQNSYLNIMFHTSNIVIH